MTYTRDDLLALDREDTLAHVRDRFILPDGEIYLDGNSLGPLPRSTAEKLHDVVHRQWGHDQIRAWNKYRWIHLPRELGDRIGRLIGARPGEVVVGDSTSVNLFKAIAAGLRLRPDRRVIVSEINDFPSDLYIAQGLVDLLGDQYQLRLAESGGLDDMLDDTVAVVSLTHVNYRTGRMHDLAAVTSQVHRQGAIMLWDLSHSAGSLSIRLDDAGVDLACGCGYKFLNGGPGAPAFVYAAERWHDQLSQPLTGWLGHARPFDFVPEYQPADGVGRMICGTPPILSMTALDAGLSAFDGVEMADVREKSIRQGQLFLELVDQECGGHGFSLRSPEDPHQRGSQVCLGHAEGYRIIQALIARGVIGDFRAPDVLRFGITPLYLRYTDIWDAVAHLRAVMETRAWDDDQFIRKELVT